MRTLNEGRGQPENRRRVEEGASEAGLTLSGFWTNDALELYYAIKCGRRLL
jgi:hypothetical protein